jgi:hypothetical protein
MTIQTEPSPYGVHGRNDAEAVVARWEPKLSAYFHRDAEAGKMAGFSLWKDAGQPAGKDLGALAAATRCLLFAPRLRPPGPATQQSAHIKHLFHLQTADKFPAPNNPRE